MRTMTRMTTAAGLTTTAAGLGLVLLLGTPGVATAQGPGEGGTGCPLTTGVGGVTVAQCATSTLPALVNPNVDTGINIFSRG